MHFIEYILWACNSSDWLLLHQLTAFEKTAFNNLRLAYLLGLLFLWNMVGIGESDNYAGTENNLLSPKARKD